MGLGTVLWNDKRTNLLLVPIRIQTTECEGIPRSPISTGDYTHSHGRRTVDGNQCRGHQTDSKQDESDTGRVENGNPGNGNGSPTPNSDQTYGQDEPRGDVASQVVAAFRS